MIWLDFFFPSELWTCLCLSWDLENSWSLFLQIFFLSHTLFSSWDSTYTYIRSFDVVWQFMNAPSVLVSRSLFFLFMFQFLVTEIFLLTYNYVYWFFLLLCELSDKPLRTFFTSITLFFRSSISIWFLQFSFLCWYYLSDLTCFSPFP